jgi:recombination protein RecR
MTAIEEATRQLSRMPGIGPKTALRLVHHLLKRPEEETRRLAASLVEMASRVRPCQECGNYSEATLCEVCSNPRRDQSVICVVEEAYEVGAIERTGQFKGLYHVLGGHLSPLDGVGPDQLRIQALLERLFPGTDPAGESGNVGEVILATNPSVEGEATAVYLEGLIRGRGPRVTRIARGVPVGSDLEYVDGTTIAEALAGRREM